MMAQLILSSDCCIECLEILYCSYIIFATVRDLCLLPGPRVRSSPSPNQVPTNFSKVLLPSLLYRLEDVLSSRLFGFLPQRSTRHCLAELYTRLSSSSIVTFIDLKSAFDTANRDIILD
ncbi:hypothetical protein E2C01_051816 [Portunus trituberculatus]|uniref:Reverse transcriptase domain-containing protein n=1 Tax=Portunus trituberculatus TaxID=210409 RepID=A0A5B7GKQ3_PORTR|nr:hypothetical protein [Portunus trituberculatus]